MHKVYLKAANKIAFISKNADSTFWDEVWEKDLVHRIPDNYKSDWLFCPVASKYLPKKAKILEGGCGNGHVVFALNKQGYKPLGVDFAERTIKKIKKLYPELVFELGDVRDLKYKANSFDGYISAGVIEHFPGGYAKILNEIKRVVKPGGYIFVTFPHLSLLRRLKIKLNK